jgi:hypothetical protein
VIDNTKHFEFCVSLSPYCRTSKCSGTSHRLTVTILPNNQVFWHVTPSHCHHIAQQPRGLARHAGSLSPDCRTSKCSGTSRRVIVTILPNILVFWHVTPSHCHHIAEHPSVLARHAVSLSPYCRTSKCSGTSHRLTVTILPNILVFWHVTPSHCHHIAEHPSVLARHAVSLSPYCRTSKCSGTSLRLTVTILPNIQVFWHVTPCHCHHIAEHPSVLARHAVSLSPYCRTSKCSSTSRRFECSCRR